MKLYSIDYDLRQPGRDYSTLYAAIKSYGNWCRALESHWIVATTTSAAAIRDHLSRYMDANDRLLVTRLSGEAAWMGLSDEVSGWLKQQLESPQLV